MTVSHLYRIQSLGKRTNLVHLDKDRVSSTHFDAFLQELHIRNKEVVTNQLATVSDGSCKLHPVVPIVLVKTVLDGINRIFGDEFFQELDLLGSCELLAVSILLLTVLQLAVVVEPLTVLLNSKLAGSAVHCYLHILSRLITGILDCLTDALNRILYTIECRSETTLVADSSRKSTNLQELDQGMEHLSTHTDGLFLIRGTHRTNHKLLESDWRIRVSTAIDDVHHRNGKAVSVTTTDIAIQWDVEILGCSMSHCKRYAKNSIGSQV